MLDGTERDPLNPTYTCMVQMTPGWQYITWKNALREEDDIFGDKRLLKETNKKDNLAGSKENLRILSMLYYPSPLSLIVFLLG